MHRILLIGNPNVGKSTLFNSLTKSNEHTGNFHGVTVEEKSKIIKFENEEYEVFDLPGIYSLNTFSYEEEVSKNIILKSKDINFFLVDANSLRRNLYLALQLKELGIKFKILINNFDHFKKKNNSINIDLLSQNLGVDIQVVNAKKIKLDKNLLKNEHFDENLPYFYEFLQIFKKKYNLNKEKTAKVLNGIFDNFAEEQQKEFKSYYTTIIKARYSFIDKVLLECTTGNKNFVYGESKLDKFLLNPIVMSFGFVLTFLLSIYVIFFWLGPFISEWISVLFEFVVINPFMNLLYTITDNLWLLEFFKNGVFNSFVTVIGFLPQVCLLFVFLTILEDSGLISRMAYVFDDFLSPLGLNGKAVYIILLGLGCNSMSTMATRNMNEKNLKIKSAIINPYISCMARLPVFVLVASAFFGTKAYFIVAGLYVLGFIIALLMALILNKTILPSKSSELLLEFPPIRKIDFKHLFQTCKTNAIDFAKRVFTIVLCVGIIVWILTHTQYNLKFTENITESVLFWLANKVTFIFAPIGLNNAGVVCALIVGVMAKELIVSTISICNNSTTTKMLTSSLISATSVINFSVASAVSFLIFSLLYCPCVSNLAILKKETDKFYMWFAIVSQFTIAYLISFAVYQSLTKGILVASLLTLAIALIFVALLFIIKKVKHNKCLTCGRCR